MRLWLASLVVLLVSCGGGDAPPMPAQGEFALGANPPQGAEVAEPAFFDWAQRTYPELFNESPTQGVEGPYTYRFYAATRNYLAVANGGVYVQGPVSGGVVRYVGPLGAFACQVTPADCRTSASTPAVLSVAGSLRVSDPAAVRSVQTYLVAGTSYHFDVRGAATGEGTLRDPVLRLLDPQAVEVAVNDDHGATTNSRIAYTPAVSGTHTLSVTGLGGDTGTYLISAAVNPYPGGLSGPAVEASDDGQYISWPTSLNKVVVKDAGNADFRVRALDGVVADSSGLVHAGLTVDSTSRAISRDARTVGYVGYYTGASGRTRVTMFYCTDGSRMEINRTNGDWSHSCGWAGGVGVPAAGSRYDVSVAATFHTWADGANDDVVLDSSDGSWRFYSNPSQAGGRCLYSDATREGFSNFCLAGGSRIYFGDSTFTVSRVRSKTGACVTALLNAEGFMVNLRTAGGQVASVVKGNRRPVMC